MKKRKITSMLMIISLALTTVHTIGCGREKEKPVVQEKKIEQLTRPEDLPSDIPVISGEPRTIIPEDVRKKWKGVRLVVEDLRRKSMDEYSLNIGEELKIPESRMTIKVVEFLPDLKIDERKEGTVFTSETDELKNPAVHIVIKDDGNIVFKGWLFSLFPDIHPFRHERFGITLKEPIAAT
ncbi:MAG: hypothetical protein AAB014_07315 [Nitrospirota bacterium]